MSKKTYNYKVTFHFVNGSNMTVEVKDHESPKQQFIDHMTGYKFISVDRDNYTTINMGLVLYIEVQELEKKDGRIDNQN